MAQERSQPRERSATTRVREWIRDAVDPKDRATTQAITEAAVEWLQREPDLLDRFVYEQLFNTCGEILRSVMLNTRRVKRMEEMLEETTEAQQSRLQQWFDRMEHVSPRVGYVRLGAMTRVELREAREERARRVLRDGSALRWYAMLEAGLPDDETTVEQRYTATQVEACYESATDAVSSRMDSILDGVAPALRAILEPDEGQPTSTPTNGGGK